MSNNHHYQISLRWTGNIGQGTADYRSYTRDHIISAPQKIEIPCSSDPAFRGDKSRYNPEELLLASLASCHMLWFLHLCADSKIVVIGYTDNPVGLMSEDKHGGAAFTGVTLRPAVKVSPTDKLHLVNDLHRQANKLCFIANSVNFPVKHEPSVTVDG